MYPGKDATSLAGHEKQEYCTARESMVSVSTAFVVEYRCMCYRIM